MLVLAYCGALANYTTKKNASNKTNETHKKSNIL